MRAPYTVLVGVLYVLLSSNCATTPGVSIGTVMQKAVSPPRDVLPLHEVGRSDLGSIVESGTKLVGTASCEGSESNTVCGSMATVFWAGSKETKGMDEFEVIAAVLRIILKAEKGANNATALPEIALQTALSLQADNIVSNAKNCFQKECKTYPQSLYFTLRNVDGTWSLDGKRVDYLLVVPFYLENQEFASQSLNLGYLDGATGLYCHGEADSGQIEKLISTKSPSKTKVPFRSKAMTGRDTIDGRVDCVNLKDLLPQQPYAIFSPNPLKDLYFVPMASNGSLDTSREGLALFDLTSLGSNDESESPRAARLKIIGGP